MFHKIIAIKEPIRAQNILVILNNFVHAHHNLQILIPFLADIFVFSYPIYLSILYILGIYKKRIEYKIWALYTFFCVTFAVGLNLMIQYFVDKQRPEQLVLSKENLIFSHVPDSPFPSDHAVVSSTIAMSVLLIGIAKKQKTLIFLGILFGIFSIIMSLCRVSAGVHWLTDVIVGSIIGIIVALVLNIKTISNFFNKNLYANIIKLETFILEKFLKIKQ